ncbi:GNAT family N-acetyltransferase [Brevibacillus gelatini]|uniref:GNAT family N-acetyltransferase n=1 Tax=Brevibacillus gelatini TaxID=1655277 RepID=UPI003D8145CF
MTPQQSATIVKASDSDIVASVAFMMKIRREVFPMIDHDVLPADLGNFSQSYMQPGSALLIATVEEAGIIGSIGVVPYDDRIAEIKGRYDVSTTAEIVKCYVDPRYRRGGLGSRLVGKALQFIAQSGYQTAYLHTHRFLPGAVSFWQRNGFAIRMEGEDDWQTVHMDYSGALLNEKNT